MSKCDDEIKSDNTCPSVPRKTSTGRVFRARSPQTRIFWNQSESAIFLPSSVFPILSDLFDNAELCP